MFWIDGFSLADCARNEISRKKPNEVISWSLSLSEESVIHTDERVVRFH